MLCPILSSGLAGLRREISSSSTTLTVKMPLESRTPE